MTYKGLRGLYDTYELSDFIVPSENLNGISTSQLIARLRGRSGQLLAVLEVLDGGILYYHGLFLKTGLSRQRLFAFDSSTSE